jgi:TP901 family phage tail tape measure protein
MTVGEVTTVLKINLTNFRNGLQQANALLDQHRETALRTAGVLAGFGGAVAAGLGVATQKAAEFEAQMRNVNSILKMSEGDFAALGESVLALAGKTGQAPAVLARGLYDIASSGFEGADGLKVLEAAAIGATAGITDTATAARAVTGVLNAYGMSADKAGYVQDVLFKTVERGVLTYGDLAQNLGEVVSLAAQANVPLEEIGAAIAAITKAGVVPSRAFTSLGQVLQSLISPSAQAKAAASALGIDLSAAALASKGLVGVMTDMGQKLQVSAADLKVMAEAGATDAQQMELLAKASGASVEQLAALFPNVEALRGALVMAADGGRTLSAEMLAMTDASGSAAAAFAEQSKSFQVQWAQTTAALQAFLIEIGSSLLPVLKAMAVALTAVVRVGELVPGPLRDTAVAVAALGAAVFALSAGTMLYQTQLKETIGLTMAWMKAMALATGMAKGQVATGTVVTLAGAMVKPGDFSLLVNTARGMEVVTGAAAGVGVAFRGAATAAKAFFGSIGPLGWVAIAVGAAAEAWMLYRNHVEKAAKAQREQMESAKQQVAALRELLDQLTAVNDKIAEAQGQPGGAVPKNLLTEQQRIADELGKQFPQLVKGYTVTGHAILLAADAQGRFGDASQRALDMSKDAARQSTYAAGQASNLAQERLADIQTEIAAQQKLVDSAKVEGVPGAVTSIYQRRLDELKGQRTKAAEAARIAEDAEKQAMAAQNRLMDWEQRQHQTLAQIRRAAGAAALAEIDRETAAMRAAGVDQLTLEQYKQQRMWLEAKKWTDERVKLQIELLKAQGKTDEAAILEAARAARAEFNAAAGDKGKRVDAEMRLQAALTAISVSGATTRAEAVRAEAKQWLQDAQDLYKAGVLNAGEYIDQLNRIAEATGRIAEAQKKAGDSKWIELAAQQMDAQRAAAEELVSLKDKLHEGEKKLHDERLQWTEDERQARAGLYQHELRMLELTRAYALDQLKITQQDSEYARGQINKAYLDQLAAARPSEGLETTWTGPGTEKERLAQAAAQPSAEDLSAWAEKYREATMTAAEQHAISDAEAVQRLTDAKNAALEAERAAADQDRAKFEERRTQHEKVLAMLEDEQSKLTTYIGQATSGLSGVMKALADNGQALRDSLGRVMSNPARAAIAGMGKIETVGVPGSIHFHAHGEILGDKVSPKLEAAFERWWRETGEGILADDLEREQRYSRS